MHVSEQHIEMIYEAIWGKVNGCNEDNQNDLKVRGAMEGRISKAELDSSGSALPKAKPVNVILFVV